MRHPMRKPWTKILAAIWAAQRSECGYPIDCAIRASIVGEGLSLACVLVAEGELDTPVVRGYPHMREGRDGWNATSSPLVPDLRSVDRRQSTLVEW